MPLRTTVCGDPEASSAIETEAEKLAAESGVKVTEMEQLAPAASVAPQVLVWANSDGFVPVTVIPLMFSTALPVFLSVATCAVAVVPDCAVKLSEVGVMVAMGAGGAVPMPLRITVCGDPVALSAIERMAVKAATDAGVKVTEIEQVAFAASELPQLLV